MHIFIFESYQIPNFLLIKTKVNDILINIIWREEVWIQ